jgi:hypothetical protein
MVRKSLTLFTQVLYRSLIVQGKTCPLSLQLVKLSRFIVIHFASLKFLTKSITENPFLLFLRAGPDVNNVCSWIRAASGSVS